MVRGIRNCGTVNVMYNSSVLPHGKLNTQTTQTKHLAEANQRNDLTCFSLGQQSGVTVPQRERRIRKGVQAPWKEAAALIR
ncbi:hypothetical protein CDAR_310671 [Caerostris darwini]|uniref:Uncharacterized protein n=1 Tax=Caerostris darwini TaxID=1538125 RepID=A0AAV4TYA1_9ARAC|nr:hypothetical protein CDAR_310671 [Caerostris darwini]